MYSETGVEGPPAYRGQCIGWLVGHLSDDSVLLYKDHLSTETTITWSFECFVAGFNVHVNVCVCVCVSVRACLRTCVRARVQS